MSSTTTIFQRGRVLPELEQVLAERFDLHSAWQMESSDQWLKEHGHEVEVLVTAASAGVTEALLDQLPNLKMISGFGVGYETYDVEAIRRRKLLVGYTPDVLNDCVADAAMGLLIDVARELSSADRHVRRGDWVKVGRYHLTKKVTGSRLGIVGLGRIGLEIAKRAEGFRMDIRYMNRRPRTDVSYTFEPSLQELAHWCDFLLVAADGGARNLIDASVLEALGPDGYLINVSRGTVVDEQALVDALKQKRIAGAGMDVVAVEPHVPPELLAMDNVVVLPHLASGTRETRKVMGDMVLENIECYLAGRPLVAPIPGVSAS